jgi:hypothetical protein
MRIFGIGKLCGSEKHELDRDKVVHCRGRRPAALAEKERSMIATRTKAALAAAGAGKARLEALQLAL